jgi:putative flavoprotein involved in K+ transport
MSQVLGAQGVEHVVLERGAVANAWRTERWDSLRLLTPNWMCRLPGHRYAGDDPDGYMSAAEVAEFVSAYAEQVAAPVVTRAPVQRIAPDGAGYRVETPDRDWRCRAVVLATGAASQPLVPRLAADLPASVVQLAAQAYRNPSQLPDGGVLVVGASASGLQLAQEIHRSGRPVTLAVGEHVRLPRLYRGRDIQWWMLASGVLDRRIEQEDEPDRARRVPSPQLVGTPARTTLDLNALRGEGVEIAGRLVGVRDGRAQFSGSLANVCALADLKMNRLLTGLDDWASQHLPARALEPVERFPPTEVDCARRPGLALGSDVRTVLWATGYRADHSFLDMPVFDHHGALRHDRGIGAAPGLYVLGLPYLRRRKSSFIHGAEDDVRELGAHLLHYLKPARGTSGARGDATLRPRKDRSLLQPA